MIKRVPIRFHRKSIKLPPHVRMQLKLWEVMEETREEDIYAMSQHYNMLVMEVTHKAGYNSLSLKNYTEHKNWIHFERVYEICRMKGWDSKLYLEGQFERARGWTNMKFPLPNTLYSVNALRSFTNHLSTLKQKYREDTRGGEKQIGRETKSLRTKVVGSIVSSVEMLSRYVEVAKMDDKAQYKALKVFQSWGEFSPYYLWSIPWFHEVINEIDGVLVEKCKQEFDTISNSPMLKKVIEETVEKVEKHFNIPENIEF